MLTILFFYFSHFSRFHTNFEDFYTNFKKRQLPIFSGEMCESMNFITATPTPHHNRTIILGQIFNLIIMLLSVTTVAYLFSITNIDE